MLAWCNVNSALTFVSIYTMVITTSIVVIGGGQ
jgi:hypothetical protein